MWFLGRACLRVHVYRCCRGRVSSELFRKIEAPAVLIAGIQYNLNGNVIANSGFVRQFGIPNPKGSGYVLPADRTALWGAMQSFGQLVGMCLLNPISDLVGRKMTLYVLWLILLGVSESLTTQNKINRLKLCHSVDHDRDLRQDISAVGWSQAPGRCRCRLHTEHFTRFHY
jgi:hypothetical protein